MNKITLEQIAEIKPEAMIALMNHPLVQKYLPLATAPFTQDDYEAFIKAKQQLWRKHGYGPYAILIGAKFAGWGGLQHENGDADFALVLHPDFWGYGLRLFYIIKKLAFEELKFKSITALLPQQRRNIKAISRLGFVADGECDIVGVRFLRFRLHA